MRSKEFQMFTDQC